MYTPQPDDHLLPLKPIPRRNSATHTASPDTVFARLSGSIGMRKKGVDATLVEVRHRFPGVSQDYMSCVALDLRKEAVHDWATFLRDLAGDLGLPRDSMTALITQEEAVYLLFRQGYQGTSARHLFNCWTQPGVGIPYIHQMGHGAFHGLINSPNARFPCLHLRHEYEDKGRCRYRMENLMGQLHAVGQIVWLEVERENAGVGTGDVVDVRVAFSTTEERRKAWRWMRAILTTCRQETLISAEEANAPAVSSMA